MPVSIQSNFTAYWDIKKDIGMTKRPWLISFCKRKTENLIYKLNKLILGPFATLSL